LLNASSKLRNPKPDINIGLKLQSALQVTELKD